MLNSEKKTKQNKYFNSRVVRKKNYERNKITYPPCKLNGRSLETIIDAGITSIVNHTID